MEIGNEPSVIICVNCDSPVKPGIDICPYCSKPVLTPFDNDYEPPLRRGEGAKGKYRADIVQIAGRTHVVIDSVDINFIALVRLLTRMGLAFIPALMLVGAFFYALRFLGLATFAFLKGLLGL